MNYLDPDGEDAIAIYDDKIHIALISGPVDGQFRYDSYGLDSKNHRHGVYYFDSLESAMEFADEKRYTHYERWFTTPEQDQKIWDECDKYHSGKGGNYEREIDYDVRFHNCGTFVQSVLGKVLKTHELNPCEGIVRPVTLFMKNKGTANQNGTIKKLLESFTKNKSDEHQ